MNEHRTLNFLVLAEALKRARYGSSHQSRCVLRFQRSHEGTVFARLIVPTTLSWTDEGLLIELGMPGRPGNPFLLPSARILESDLVEQAIPRIRDIVNWTTSYPFDDPKESNGE